MFESFQKKRLHRYCTGPDKKRDIEVSLIKISCITNGHLSQPR